MNGGSHVGNAAAAAAADDDDDVDHSLEGRINPTTIITHLGMPRVLLW